MRGFTRGPGPSPGRENRPASLPGSKRRCAPRQRCVPHPPTPFAIGVPGRRGNTSPALGAGPRAAVRASAGLPDRAGEGLDRASGFFDQLDGSGIGLAEDLRLLRNHGPMDDDIVTAVIDRRFARFVLPQGRMAPCLTIYLEADRWSLAIVPATFASCPGSAASIPG